MPGVAVAVLQGDLFDQPGFAVVGPARATDPHADLGRGVAAQHGAVLHQGHLGPVPCGGDRRAHTRQAAADDAEIDFVGEVSHRVYCLS